jgi:hypothetical protein
MGQCCPDTVVSDWSDRLRFSSGRSATAEARDGLERVKNFGGNQFLFDSPLEQTFDAADSSVYCPSTEPIINQSLAQGFELQRAKFSDGQ